MEEAPEVFTTDEIMKISEQILYDRDVCSGNEM